MPNLETVLQYNVRKFKPLATFPADFSAIKIQCSELFNHWYSLCVSLYISIPKYSVKSDAFKNELTTYL